ncbi:MAG: ABC transporter ATP-binding protein [Spirochaetes bacterium]|nr:ABC transporter ATP-binding protein [Spirochaetota bacterium]
MGTGQEVAVRLESLAKFYKDVRAVDGLDLEIRRGEIYGFLGRNGAGKTSTIRMMLALTRPSRGRIAIFGLDAQDHRTEILRRTGSLVESATAYPNLTVRENLDMQCRLTGTPRPAIESSIKALNLGECADRCYGKLSLGNKQRLALARAILHSPELLVLDEPANGLDPAGIAEIRMLLRKMADERKTTIFVSSHILGEVAQLADRIGIIHRGRMIAEFGSHSMSALTSRRIELETGDPERAASIIRALDPSLAVDVVSPTVTPGGTGRVHVSVRTAAAHAEPDSVKAFAAAISKGIVGAGIALYRIGVEEENLESLFLRLTGGDA